MAVAVAVAVAERPDVVDAREKKYKNSFIHQKVLVTCVADVETKWLPNANYVVNPPNDNSV